MIWYNPPYSSYIKNNIGKRFLNLIGKHFKPGTFLGKLFNRNNLKLSYSCCPKVRSKISSHNRRLLSQTNQQPVPDVCNCRDKSKCPMKGLEPCNVGSVVYRADITAEGTEEMKYYIGATNNFKLRYANHKKSFLEVSRRNDSGLAEQVWAWKESGLSPIIKFSVVCKQSEYNPLAKKCSLCIREKLHIMKALEDPNNLNHKKELMGHCLHRVKSLLSNINLIGYKHSKDLSWFDTGQNSGYLDLPRPLLIDIDSYEENNEEELNFGPNFVDFEPSNQEGLELVQNLVEIQPNNEETSAQSQNLVVTLQTNVKNGPGTLRNGKIWR